MYPLRFAGVGGEGAGRDYVAQMYRAESDVFVYPLFRAERGEGKACDGKIQRALRGDRLAGKQPDRRCARNAQKLTGKGIFACDGDVETQDLRG